MVVHAFVQVLNPKCRGAFCNSGQLLFPILLICDENGEYIDFNEEELVQALEKIDDMDVKYFTPTEPEIKLYQRIYDNLTAEMLKRFQKQTEPLTAAGFCWKDKVYLYRSALQYGKCI